MSDGRSGPSFLRVYLDFNDWWIGVYRGPNHWYICPLPCVVIRFRRRKGELSSASNQPPGAHKCAACGTTLETAIDMSRVYAGVGGPRPYYVCPNRENHIGNRPVEFDFIKREVRNG